MYELDGKYYILGVEVDKATYDKYADRKYLIGGEHRNLRGVGAVAIMLPSDANKYLAAWQVIEQVRKELQIRKEVSEPTRIGSLDRVCPISFASAEPRKCGENCAWFVTYDGWDEGCCAAAAVATCIRNIDDSLNGEGIYSELNAISCTLQNANATP